jgi:protein farnesyltransferase/geranylgeranyltransferase type-1 subunit alpha
MKEDINTQEIKFIPFKERGELWKDIDPVPQFTDNVEILKIDYDDKFREINDYFRAILHKNEISVRAYNLTTELILVNYF